MLSVPAATRAMSYSICSVQHRTYVVEIRAEAMFFASPVMYLLLLPAPLTHRIHWTVCVIFSWKGTWVRQKLLAHCDNFILYGQNQYWSTFWIILVWDFVACFKWSLCCILCDFIVCVVPHTQKECVSWESVSKEMKETLSVLKAAIAYYSVESGWSFS